MGDLKWVEACGMQSSKSHPHAYVSGRNGGTLIDVAFVNVGEAVTARTFLGPLDLFILLGAVRLGRPTTAVQSEHERSVSKAAYSHDPHAT